MPSLFYYLLVAKPSFFDRIKAITGILSSG